MTDEALSSLKSLRFAQPSPEAKKLALNAAMVAFDAAQASKHEGRCRHAAGCSHWKLGAGLGVPLGDGGCRARPVAARLADGGDQQSDRRHAAAARAT